METVAKVGERILRCPFTGCACNEMCVGFAHVEGDDERKSTPDCVLWVWVRQFTALGRKLDKMDDLDSTLRRIANALEDINEKFDGR
jgi:hypothetical protein